MADEPTQRRLAAVLAADVVGFSRLMEQDESGTMAALKARRSDLLQPLVRRYHGRIFKFTGDGALVEFNSAVNAVQCAIDLQKAMDAANSDLAPARSIVLRIGINLGDIIVEGSDLYGDGVNVATRLEGLAEPGGICISRSVYDQVKRKVEFEVDELGPQAIKNISEPVHVYSVRLGVRQARDTMDRIGPSCRCRTSRRLPSCPSTIWATTLNRSRLRTD